MKLRPSKIFYSQDSIGNHFNGNSEVGYRRIGKTLDDICEGRLDIEDIPRIDVARLDDKWVTCDNRRLWVFRMLEQLGMCGKIDVDEIDDIPAQKLTSVNGGVDIRVRGNPGGHWYKKVDESSDSEEEEEDSSDDESISTSDDDYYHDDSDEYESLNDQFDGLYF